MLKHREGLLIVGKRLSWRKHLSKLELINEQVYSGEISSLPLLVKQLGQILGEGSIIRGTDTRVLAFIEFSFFKVEGPYSTTFQRQVEVMKTVLDLYPPIKNLLNSSANHALANMVLNGRGKLKFKICDRYELIKVLNAWEYIGLKRRNQRSVFNAILTKPTIQRRLHRPDFFLLARLESIFPQWRHEINPQGVDIEQALFNLHRSRFDEIIQEKVDQGQSLESIIASENNRKLPVGLKRNSFLSYLLKRKHNYTCQLQKHLICRPSSRFPQEVQSHHIIPLYKGGEDHSSNLIVLCSHHHDLVHQHKLQIDLQGTPPRIKVQYKGKYFTLRTN